MPATASVNYHFPTPKRQAYHIDAGGEKGKLVSPPHAVTQVKVGDVRRDGVVIDFRTDSVGFADHISAVTDFDISESWKPTYDDELRALLTEKLELQEVVVFDHTVRIDDPNSDRKPARNVHSDYSPDGAHQRLRDLLGDEKAAQWESGHFAFINVWRPVKAQINSAPLGFVRPSSVATDDWLTIDRIYPDRVGQILGLVPNEAHEWVYKSKMTPDEVAFFNIYDNRGLPSIAHSALDMVEDANIKTPRMSIESRTLVRY